VSTTAAVPWPVELKFSRTDRALAISFDDGSSFKLPAEYLRVESPSAEVQGHGAGQKQIVAGKRNVGVTRIEPVGRYAARIVFDDGHDTGLFSWAYLHQLGREHAARWAEYERRLAHARQTRDA
jgi:DUF971 family protein